MGIEGLVLLLTAYTLYAFCCVCVYMYIRIMYLYIRMRTFVFVHSYSYIRIRMRMVGHTYCWVKAHCEDALRSSGLKDFAGEFKQEQGGAAGAAGEGTEGRHALQVKRCKREQDALDEVEFDWVRQFFFQVRTHRTWSHLNHTARTLQATHFWHAFVSLHMSDAYDMIRYDTI